MITILYSWRNLWRNSRRTLITLAALALNTAVLIATLALIDGYVKNSIASAAELVTGEAQIHAEEYLEDHSLYKIIDNPGEIIKAAEDNGIGAVERTFGFGLVSSGKKSAGARFTGIDPADEKATFKLASHVAEGEFLGNNQAGGIVLGKKLARILNAEVGSEIIVMVGAYDGSLGNELYHVTGILKSAGENIDRSAALIHITDFREIYVMPEGIHEIALNSRGHIPPENFKRIIGQPLGTAELKTWRELLPAFSDLINLSKAGTGIVMAIFFLAAGLGIMNTMLMATYDRMREFGILKALGAGPWRIIGNVLMEALMLSVLATVVGIIIGWIGGYYLEIVGIDTGALAGETSFAGVAFDPIWRAAMSVDVVIRPVITMWIICVLASLYPAILASRLEPVKAMEAV